MNKKWMLFTCIMFSTTGLMGMESDKTAGAWTDKPERILGREHFDGDHPLASSPDRKYILTITASSHHSGCEPKGRDLCIWDAATGHLIHELEKDCQVSSALYSRDGNLIATAYSESSIVRIYDAHTGKLLAALEQGQPVLSVEFSPDCTKLRVTCKNK